MDICAAFSEAFSVEGSKTVAKACIITFGLELSGMKVLAVGAGTTVFLVELRYLLEVTGLYPKVFGFVVLPLSNNDDTFG